MSADTASSTTPDEQERAHYTSVLQSFHEYQNWMEPEIRRREIHHLRLSDHCRALLPQGVAEAKFQALRQCIQTNQHFFQTIIAAITGTDIRANTANKSNPHKDNDLHETNGQDPTTDTNSVSGSGDASCIQPNATQPTYTPIVLDTPTTPKRHFEKLVAILRHCVRDWSQEGATERTSSYQPILDALQQYLPVDEHNRNKQRVLVPGAGLGRLTYEIASKGYAAQGNDFSYFMLLTSSFLLNHCRTPEKHQIHPWIHDASNHMRPADMLRSISIPDVSAASLLEMNPEADFSMVAGDFLEVYKNTKNEWDAVATCFFLDTAPNVFEYIETIHRLLKPGGYWINLGPLLWHWQDKSEGANDTRYYQSIELSYYELRHVIYQVGFEILAESSCHTQYGANILSMSKSIYNCVAFTVRKPLKPSKPSQ